MSFKRKIILFILFLFVYSCNGETDNISFKTSYPSSISSITCPTPLNLPFTLRTTKFNHPDNIKKAKVGNILGYSAIDFFANSDQYPQVLTGIIGYGSGIAITDFIYDEWVSLWYYNGDSWLELGRNKTDSNGRYSITIPDNLRFSYGTHKLYVVVEGDKSCTEQVLSIHPDNSKFIVTDIDGTLTANDTEIVNQMADTTYFPVSWPGAVELMSYYAKKGYYLVYLTARPNGFRVLTREWLIKSGYPLGLMITAPEYLHGADVVNYKAGSVRKLFYNKWEIIAVHGNAETDIEAYQEVGISNNNIFIIGENAGKLGSTAVISYPDFMTSSFIKTLPNANQPDK